MAQSIVACPGCGRKYRVAEDAPAGEFECTQCGTAVTYGAAAAAHPAAARPARPARARPARGAGGGHGRGAAGPPRGGAARGRERPGRAAGRGGRYSDRDGGPPEKSNAALYAVLGVGALVVVAVIVVLLVTSGNGNGGAQHTANQGLPGVSPSTDMQPLDSSPPSPAGAGTAPAAGAANAGTAPAPAGSNGSGTAPGATSGIGGANKPPPLHPSPGAGQPAPEPGRPANAPSGELYQKDLTTLRKMSIPDLIKGLGHLDDTPTDVRQKIDKLCTDLVDYSAGSAQISARNQLARIGRPAIPMILAAYAKVGDVSTDEGKANACTVEGTLRDICGDAVRARQLVPMMADFSKKISDETMKTWLVWWYTKGWYEKFDKSDDGDE